MSLSWNTQKIGDIVALLPKATELFKSHRIDFCCGGKRTLGDVLDEMGISGQEIYDKLDTLSSSQASGAEVDFVNMSPDDLARYIQARHHAYLRDALPEIGQVFTTVLKAHGAKHPELFQAHSLFGRLRTDLEQHLVKEEIFLFPALENGITPETVRLVGEIIAEHEAAGAVLKQQRTMMNDYTASEDACKTYRLLMDELLDMEEDLMQHIHLENNILFKYIQVAGGDR